MNSAQRLYLLSLQALIYSSFQTAHTQLLLPCIVYRSRLTVVKVWSEISRRFFHLALDCGNATSVSTYVTYFDS